MLISRYKISALPLQTTNRATTKPKYWSLHVHWPGKQQSLKGLHNFTRCKALNLSVSNCSAWKWTHNLMNYWCSLGLMSARLHHNGSIMAEEYKSILQDQEHPRVQPVLHHDVCIFLPIYTATYTAKGLRCDSYTDISSLVFSYSTH